MENKTYRGSAINDGMTLSAPLHVGDAVAQVAGGLAGWPNGADHRLFVMQVDAGTAAEERVLCSQISGTDPATITITTRGYDGTVEQEHAVSATVEHDLDAEVVDELVLHVVDDSRDDHDQYLTIGRHDTPIRHLFGADEALGTPVAPADVATAAAVGTDDSPARSDHVHKIGAAAIDDSGMFAPGVVDVNALGTDAVGTDELGTNAVAPANLQLGLAATAVANHDVATLAADGTHIAMPPDPAVVTFWRQSDKQRRYVSDGTAWRWADGSPVKAVLAYSVDGSGIANGFGVHDLNGFTADADEFAMASAGSTLTIPANVGGPPAYKFDGEWDIIWEILVSDATAVATVELLLVTNLSTFTLEIGPTGPSGHSTMFRGRKTVPLLAGATAKLQLAHSAPGTVAVKAGSSFEARYRGAL